MPQFIYSKGEKGGRYKAFSSISKAPAATASPDELREAKYHSPPKF